MWLVIGVIIGFLLLFNTGNILLFFWPILIGYFLNSISISGNTGRRRNYSNYSYLANNKLFSDSFSLLSAKVTMVNGLNRLIINQVKNFAVDIFGVENAKIVMQQYKYYVENGISNDELSTAYRNIRTGLNIDEKNFLIKVLFRIEIYDGMSKKGLDAIKEIADNIGADFFEYNIYSRLFTGGYYQGGSSYSYDRGDSYGNYRQEPIREPKDYYKILGIHESSSDDEIKKRYRELCKEYHPDKTISLPEEKRKEYEEKLKEIIEAYQEIKKIRGIN